MNYQYENYSRKNKLQQKNFETYDFGGYEFKLNSLEKKANKCYFSGYASVFNTLDNQNDIILPGAFKKSIENKKKYILLWQHNHCEPIGKITNVKEDKNGLSITGELILGIRRANDVYFMLKNDILDSFSIGYTALDYEFEYSKCEHSREEIRIIKDLKLWEISLVTFPANNFARINSIGNNIDHITDQSFESFDFSSNKNSNNENDYLNYDELYKYMFDDSKESQISEKKKVNSNQEMIEKFKETIKIINS